MAMENGPFIDDFPSYKPPFMVGIFHGYVSHNQIVLSCKTNRKMWNNLTIIFRMGSHMLVFHSFAVCLPHVKPPLFAAEHFDHAEEDLGGLSRACGGSLQVHGLLWSHGKRWKCWIRSEKWGIHGHCNCRHCSVLIMVRWLMVTFMGTCGKLWRCNGEIAG